MCERDRGCTAPPHAPFLLLQRQHERTTEQEKQEKQRQIPFHQHINLEVSRRTGMQIHKKKKKKFSNRLMCRHKIIKGIGNLLFI